MRDGFALELKKAMPGSKKKWLQNSPRTWHGKLSRFDNYARLLRFLDRMLPYGNIVVSLYSLLACGLMPSFSGYRTRCIAKS